MSINLKAVQTVSVRSQGRLTDLNGLNVMTDSRKPIDQGLFIPLTGETFDAHHFVKQAIDNGAVATLWQEDHDFPSDMLEDFPVFFVQNPLTALQELARNYRRKINPKVVAITGSNGKTTTKDIMDGVLSQSYETFKTQGNFNNHIGLPLTMLSMPEDCEVLITEMGMNHFGEISQLSRMAEPDFAVITNIGESHIEYLGSRAGIAQAKMEIMDGMDASGVLVIDGDEPLLESSLTKGLTTIRCGFTERNDYMVSEVHESAEGYRFEVKNRSFDIPLLGRHNVQNALFSVAVGQYLGLSNKAIQAGLLQGQMTDMRLQTYVTAAGATMINDAYNASPTSMRAAIETVKQLPEFTERVLVLGDIYELGVDEERMHRDIADSIYAPITHVYTIGEKAQWIADELQKHVSNLIIRSFKNKDAAASVLKQHNQEDTVVLFKASRAAKFETLTAVMDPLQGGTH